ncbi:MAG: peptide chain release factor 1 [Thermodesulfobacteriota bacterium]
MIFRKRLQGIVKRYGELAELLASPDVVSDHELYQGYAKEHSDLTPLVEACEKLNEVEGEIEEYSEALSGKDMDLRDLAREELPGLESTRDNLIKALKIMLLPVDPNDAKNVILELRAGAGGDESAIFVAELFRMYSRYAEGAGWKVDVLSSSPTGLNGFKEIIAMIEGKGAYSRLKYESGVHRVQRVPETEAQGRRHTSTVTVAVMPEAEQVEVDINNSDLRVDTYRAGGHGGQSVNKLETAVRITHMPTNTVVTCQDEKSQHKNRQKAMKILMARILDKKTQEYNAKVALERKEQVGTGERSEKIRTYNYPQNRVTDHRIGLTLYRLTEIMDGDLQELTDSVINHFQALALQGDEAAPL